MPGYKKVTQDDRAARSPDRQAREPETQGGPSREGSSRDPRRPPAAGWSGRLKAWLLGRPD